MYDIPPPESDVEAKTMASEIKKWISQGRPKPGQESNDDAYQNDNDSSVKEKPKKKRGLFGFLKK